ncbi:hypothetical protein GGQ84_001522 [Desulfitispora alkaliphila]|uniref:hypothetical protein n=1 Tax=Desulfitispora alkaliphila TaxID=622674 RepID=UPI003D238101
MKRLSPNSDNKAEKQFNFLINASNQANLSGAKNGTQVQINSLFLMISPFELENCEFEDLNIDIKADEQGNFWVNDRKFKLIEISPGVNILGIVTR